MMTYEVRFFIVCFDLNVPFFVLVEFLKRDAVYIIVNFIAIHVFLSFILLISASHQKGSIFFDFIMISIV